MISILKNRDVLFVGDVDEAVALIDASLPRSCESVLQGFGFPDAFERVVSEAIADQCVHALQRLAVLSLPLEVVLPALSGPRELSLNQGSRSSRSVI